MQKVLVKRGKGTVSIRLRAQAAADLELWDVARETAIFKRVFGRKLLVKMG